MRSRSVVRSLLYAMLVTGLLTGVVFPFVVHPFAEYRPGARLAFSALAIAAGVAVGAANFLLVRVFLLRPVGSVTAELAALARGERGGAPVRLDSDDELGLLVARFNALLERLRAATREVADVGEAFARDAQRSGEGIRDLAGQAAARSQVVAGTVTLHESVRGELRSVGEVLARLDASAAETIGAVAQQLEQAEAAERQVAGLRAQSERAAEGLARIARAAERASAGGGELAAGLDGAAAGTAQLEATVRQVEESIEASAAIADRVAGDAAAGGEAVESSLRTIERIQESVEGAATAIRAFSESLAGIAAVTGVIDEVTEQTNLLALNAAIIAAQAGEHGAGFAVVAGQIKKLADRAASSTREIGGLIAGFRERAGASLATLGSSRALAEEGVGVARRASEALNRIEEGAAASLQHARHLAGAMREMSATAHDLAGTVERLAGRSREIADAGREQGQALAALGDGARATRESATAIAGAAEAQLAAARRIRAQAGAVGGLVGTSTAAIRRGLEQTELLTTTVETARDLDAREREALARLERGAERLAAQARALLAGIERIRPEHGGDAGHRPGAGGA